MLPANVIQQGLLIFPIFPVFLIILFFFFVFVNSFSFIRWWVLSVVKYIVQASREFPFPTLSSNTLWKISRNRWKFSFRVSFLFFLKMTSYNLAQRDICNICGWCTVSHCFIYSSPSSFSVSFFGYRETTNKSASIWEIPKTFDGSLSIHC